jgi:hypothetical protein
MASFQSPYRTSTVPTGAGGTSTAATIDELKRKLLDSWSNPNVDPTPMQYQPQPQFTGQYQPQQNLMQQSFQPGQMQQLPLDGSLSSMPASLSGGYGYSPLAPAAAGSRGLGASGIGGSGTPGFGSSRVPASPMISAVATPGAGGLSSTVPMTPSASLVSGAGVTTVVGKNEKDHISSLAINLSHQMEYNNSLLLQIETLENKQAESDEKLQFLEADMSSLRASLRQAQETNGLLERQLESMNEQYEAVRSENKGGYSFYYVFPSK